MSSRKKRLILIVAMMAVAVGACLSFWLFREEELPDKPDITISKETTFLTEPLDRDGNVDYAEAINRRYSKGVTPENNAAVLLIRAFGPQQFEGTPFEKMGIKPPPKEGRYFVAQGAFGNVLRNQGQKITDDALWDQFSDAGEKPWKRKQYPAVAGWIEHNRPSSELIAAASRKTRFFIPCDEAMAFSIGNITAMRSSYRILICRAMLHIGEDRIEEAMEDVLSCHRLAQLFRQQSGDVPFLVSVAGHAIAADGDSALIQSGRLTTTQALKLRRALGKLTSPSSLEVTYDFDRRVQRLYLVVAAARGDDQTLEQIISVQTTEEQERFWKKHRQKIRLGLVDWNAVLRSVNQTFDKIVAAARTDDLKKREAIFKELETARDELEKKKGKLEDYISRWRIRKTNRRGVTRWFQYYFTSDIVSSVKGVFEARDRAAMRRAVVLTGFGLAAYQKDHSRYPENLTALVPKYIEEIPIDRFSGKPLRYSRNKVGFLLYSVGPNRTDNGGLSGGAVMENESENHDDIVIRVPRIPDAEPVHQDK
jgi:hypothetical protein